MASVPNRVYPLNEYNDIICNEVTQKNIARGLTVDTGSTMNIGQIIIYTGAAGVNAYLCVKLASGSGNAIWTAALTYGGIGSV